jgi:Putative DNA-binding domain
MWDEARLQSYIDNFIEEGQSLEYKAAAALKRTDGGMNEITKDVSAMANSAGGVVIYGVKEYDEKEKKHLPEKIDPLDRTEFTKEWLEHVINNIEPRIKGLLIHPVPLASGPNDVTYVVEIPQGTTAHQARNLRYYRRYNFEVLAMRDHEVKDVINRSVVPDATVEFGCEMIGKSDNGHRYRLLVTIKNLGLILINHFQLQFTFPNLRTDSNMVYRPQPHVECWHESDDEYIIRYRSDMVLFPDEERDLGREFIWKYRINSGAYSSVIRAAEVNGKPLTVEWVLNADNMPTKRGSVPFTELNRF